MNKKIKNIFKLLIFVFIAFLIIYTYIIPEKHEAGPIPYSELSYKEKNEILEEEQEKYIEKIGELEAQLEELQKEYEEAKDLIWLLQEQLISYGIEPDEL